MTSDGISTEDWNRVVELSGEMVDSWDDEALSDASRRRLLACLDDLEAKYGELPSILFSRAEYVEDDVFAEALTARAYDLALRREDHRGALDVCTSLAGLYAGLARAGSAGSDPLPVKELALEWLDRAETHLHVGNEHDVAEVAELRVKVASMP